MCVCRVLVTNLVQQPKVKPDDIARENPRDLCMSDLKCSLCLCSLGRILSLSLAGGGVIRRRRRRLLHLRLLVLHVAAQHSHLLVLVVLEVKPVLLAKAQLEQVVVQ